MWKDKILQKLKTLTDEDYKEVLCEAFQQDRPPELKKAIRKNLEKNAKTFMKEVGEGVPAEGNPKGCPEPGPSKEVSCSAGKVFIVKNDC